jgi:PAS domain S-box-containing protein
MNVPSEMGDTSAELPESSLRDFAALAAHVCDAPLGLVARPRAAAILHAPAGQADPDEFAGILAASERVLAQEGLSVFAGACAPGGAPDPTPHLFAGIRLQAGEGRTWGALCVADRVARSLDERQRDMLLRLGAQLQQRICAAFEPADAGGAAPMPAETHLAAIVDSSEDAIVGKTLDGIVTSWNAGAERLFGYSAAEMIGTPMLRVIPADRSAEEDRILQTIARGERVPRFDTLRRTRDGRVISVSVAAAPIRDHSGRVVGVSKIARDLSPLQQRERETRRIARLYAALSQVNQAIVWTRSRAELVAKVCRVLVEHGGFAMAWIGWHVAETQTIVPAAAYGDDTHLLDAHPVHVHDGAGTAGTTATAWRSEAACIHNDLLAVSQATPWRDDIERRGFRAAAAFPIREGGRAVGTLTVCADLPGFFQDQEIKLLEEAAADVSFGLDNLVEAERRRQAEAAQQASEQRYRALFRFAPDGILIADPRSIYLDANDQMCRMLGYGHDELVGLHASDIVAPAETPHIDPALATINRGENYYREWMFRRRDGSCFPAEVIATSMPDGNIMALVRDISERRLREAELRDLNDTLEQKVAQRTAELGEALVRAEVAERLKSAFLATMSHELRTPLNSIIGFTGLILKEMAGPINPEQHKQLGLVRDSARHLLHLVNDVLDLSKIEAGQLAVHAEAFSLGELLAHVIELVRPLAARKGLVLGVEAAEPPATLVSDRRRVEQILINLLNNAIKFTPSGSVTLRAQAVAAVRATPAAAPRPGVRISVSDTGIGIQAQDLDALFQPFRQIDGSLNRQREGTGLGLAISRRLAHLLDGEIEVASRWQHGSEFSLLLPLQAGERP